METYAPNQQLNRALSSLKSTLREGWASLFECVKGRCSRQPVFPGLLLLMLVMASLPAQAGLDFDGQNRFIYFEGKSRLSIVISNLGEYPTLVQTALGWGDGRTETPPLASNRPLQVIQPGKKGQIEVFYQGQGLPSDRESFLLLSVLDISQAPPTSDAITIGIQHHFKLFFRPKLEQTTDEAIAALTWSVGAGVPVPVIKNSSPYFITLSDIELRHVDGSACGKLIDHVMVDPFSQVSLDGSECEQTPSSVRYNYVTDYSNMRPYEVKLLEGGANTGERVDS